MNVTLPGYLHDIKPTLHSLDLGMNVAFSLCTHLLRCVQGIIQAEAAMIKWIHATGLISTLTPGPVMAGTQNLPGWVSTSMSALVMVFTFGVMGHLTLQAFSRSLSVPTYQITTWQKTLRVVTSLAILLACIVPYVWSHSIWLAIVLLVAGVIVSGVVRHQDEPQAPQTDDIY